MRRGINRLGFLKVQYSTSIVHSHPVTCRIIFLLLLATGGILLAQIGGTPEQCIERYGHPERDAMKESGLLYFRNDSRCVICHFDKNACDVMSLFSSHTLMGVPVELDQQEIKGLLQQEGGGSKWSPVARFTINGVWNSSDQKSFAIYDTMRHKLVIMTRAAYKREASALKEARTLIPNDAAR